MRSEEPCGGALNGPTQTATNNLTEMAGTVANIDVPKGWVAIVTAVGLIIPSSNTVGGVIMVDRKMVGQQWFLSGPLPFTSIVAVGPGHHRIAVGIQSLAPAGGQIQFPSISWVIVKRSAR
jgi:hypothetical protein